MREHLSRLGARLGNWNDRWAPDMRSDATRRYRLVDRVASFFYTLPDRPRRQEQG